MDKSDLTIVGNIVDAPRLNRTGTGTAVANFRMASTKRRFDRVSQSWVDANSFYVDIECFGELGSNVARSLVKGDPVIVTGDLYSNEWESETGKRSTPRVKADTVGPNLSRGWATFSRTPRPAADVAPPPEEEAEHPADELDDAPYDLRTHDGASLTEEVGSSAPQPALT